MLNADILLINATVVTMNAQFDIFSPGAVAVQDGQIVWVGTMNDLRRMTEDPEGQNGGHPQSLIPSPSSSILRPPSSVIDCAGHAIIPGLVNAHTHVPMTLLRGLADDLRLDVWLMGYMMPVEREFVSPDFCRLGTGLSCAEMIRSGVTTFADMYYFEDSVAQATAEAGMRALCAQSVLKFPTPDAQSYEDSLAMARDFIQRWKGHPLIVPSVAPHAPYTCTHDILRACAQLAAEFDVPLHTHLAETAQEVEDSRKLHDLPVIPYVEKTGLFEAKVLAAHCVHIDQAEIRTLRRYNAGVAHNPTSNLKLSSGVAPVTRMLQLGVNVGIGTDGPASNNDLDMFEETRLAAILAKGITGDPTVVPARQALAMATTLGAHALHIGHLTGSLEVGKRADLAVVNLQPLHNSPRFERDAQAVYSQLVYAGKSTDVRDVMVEGRWLMRDRQLTTLNEDNLRLAAQDYARRIDHFLIQREKSVLSKLAAIGGLEQEESFEVQVKARVDDRERIIALVEGRDPQTRIPTLTVLRHVHYRQFDTYFTFDDPAQGRLRYREDEFINDKGESYNLRYRLTLTLPAKEREFDHSILLSRSRFIAPARHSRRFYREYFRPTDEVEIEKDRLRWQVLYKDIGFYINLDTLVRPAEPGSFLELKSRTWSKRDAELKAEMVGELLARLGISTEATIQEEYVDFVTPDPS